MCPQKIILGNMYRPPRDINENYRQFIDEFTTVLAKLEISHSDVIIAGDFKIDLLKIHEKPIFGDYFDAITGHSFFQKITLPTRFSNMNGTLIDNFLYKISHRLLKTSAGIILSRISDHLPYFVSLDYVNIKLKNVTKFIQVKQQNASNLNNFKAELSRTNLLTNFDLSIDADPNRNYDILEHTITSAINKHLPTKTVKFNKHKHKKSNWITQGIIKSIKYRDMLYRKLKETNPHSQQHETMVINLHTYNNILKRSIRKAKADYYYSRFEKYKNDMRNTWVTIKEIISRESKTNFPESFQINNVLTKDKTIIANEFNTYFANIGYNLASKMKNNSNTTYDDFLSNPSLSSFIFQPITEETIINIIDKLKSKNSQSHDGLSSKLLKVIKHETSKAITLIVNQSLNTDIFPDKLKCAKVIPIYKKGDNTNLDNYRPISILPTVSTILERVIFDLFKSYLSNRKQYVDVLNNRSTYARLNVGVPQGSILGPLLFIIYVNDITASSNILKFIMYADDTTLFTTINCFENNEHPNQYINNELSKISEWLIVNKLSLNASKTKFMVFNMPQKKVVIPRLKLADTEIESVGQFNFIGITLDKHLNWNAHTNTLFGKISRNTGILNKIKLFLPSRILKTIYSSLILCQLNYGILVWGQNYKRMFKLQKRVMRIITCSKYNAHSEPLFKELKLLKLEDIRKLQELKFYYKLVHRQLPSYFNCISVTTINAVHQHNTRQSGNLYSDKVKHDFAKRCIRFSVIDTVNKTNTSIISKIFTHSIYGFTHYIKDWILQNYDYTCNIYNCYVCSVI